MNDDNVTPIRPSKLNRLANTARNRKVQVGVALAITAVASALIARSDLFPSRLTLDEVVDAVNNGDVTDATN